MTGKNLAVGVVVLGGIGLAWAASGPTIAIAYAAGVGIGLAFLGARRLLRRSSG